MCFNAGPLDRALRISVGIGLVVYGLGTGKYDYGSNWFSSIVNRYNRFMPILFSTKA